MERKIGIFFYQTLAMTDEVSALCKSLYFIAWRITQIRDYLSLYIIFILMVFLVLTELDYTCTDLKSLNFISNKKHKTIRRKQFSKKKDHFIGNLWKKKIDYKLWG